MSSTTIRITTAVMAAVLALTPAGVLAQDDAVPWPTDGWAISTPEAQGMDSSLLADGIEYLTEQEAFDIHSLTVIRNGHIVADAYFFPYSAGELHDLASVTKSFTATLVGMAIEQGLIEGVEQPVLELFPGRAVANLDADKEAMTVEDLLTMSQGFECTRSPDTTAQMMEASDWVQFSLDQPMTYAPGSVWAYCGSASHLLSAAIAEASGMNALDFASSHLLSPLGIDDARWFTDPHGNSRGWGDLFLHPHDAAKLGYLYLRGGEWDGRRLLSAEFVDAATSPGVAGHYGYQWWLDPLRSGFCADGAGGQRIFVFPDQALLVVTTGRGGDEYGVTSRLLDEYVLPAIRSDSPAEPDVDGQARLAAASAEAMDPPQPEPVPPPPSTARRVSGRTIALEDNPIGLASLSLVFPDGGGQATLELGLPDGSQLEWALGLDGVPRINPGLQGFPMAATGRWASEDTFVLDLDYYSLRDADRLEATFDGDAVTFEGFDVPLAGRLEGE